MTQAIETQFQNTTIPLSNALKSVYSSSKTVANSASDISSAMNSSTDQIRLMNDTLKTYEDDINSFLDYPYGYIQQINTGFYVAWSISITATLIGLIGGLGVYLFNWTRLRVLLHCSWCMLSGIMCIGFTLSSVFVPFGIITVEGCDIYSGIITSPTEYSKYTNLIPTDINIKLHTCLFGSGNLLREFGIEDQISQIDAISKSFNSVNSTGLNFSKQSNNIVIESWRNNSENLKNGLLSDSSETDDNNSFVSLGNFRKWSDYTVSGSNQVSTCSDTKDEWVFNSSNCTYSPIWSSSNSATDLKGSTVCIQINDFDSSSINGRYGSMSSSCSSSVSENNIKYFNALKGYDQSRRTLFSGVSNSLTNLKASNEDFNSKLINYNQTSYNFLSQIKNLVGNVSDEKTGIVNGFNCAFFRRVVNDSYNSLCVSFFVPVYYQTIFIACTSLLMFLMSLLAYLGGMRFTKGRKSGDVLDEDLWGKS